MSRKVVIPASVFRVLPIILLLALSACGIIGFSPETVAVQAVSDSNSDDVMIDNDSIQIHQTVRIGSGRAVVMMTFEQVRLSTGQREKCLYTYQIASRAFAWAPASGGGGCSTQAPQEETVDLEIGAGRSSGSRLGDPGLSEVYGYVNNPEIEQVRITWEDSIVEEVDVTNNTFIGFRDGQLGFDEIEGLDEQGNVIYQFSSNIDPSKQE